MTGKAGKVVNKRIKGISKEAVDIMMKYEYPGNVRELGNAIERAVVMSRGDLIIADDLPSHIRNIKTDESE